MDRIDAENYDEEQTEQGKVIVNEKRKKINTYLKTLGIMMVMLFVVFSYVYQSTKQVYLNYQIVNLNKQIDNLNIKLKEMDVENKKIQTNANIEKIASEKLGMSYSQSDKVVIIKETEPNNQENQDNDKNKIKIFMQSFYEETYNQLKSINLKSISSFFQN